MASDKHREGRFKERVWTIRRRRSGTRPKARSTSPHAAVVGRRLEGCVNLSAWAFQRMPASGPHWPYAPSAMPVTAGTALRALSTDSRYGRLIREVVTAAAWPSLLDQNGKLQHGLASNDTFLDEVELFEPSDNAMGQSFVTNEPVAADLF